MKKRLSYIIIAIMVLLVLQAVPVLAQNTLPNTDSQAALLIDAKTGKVLYEKNSNQKLQPASLTKMMTALLVVENLDLDKKVTITAEAANISGNNMALKEGEILTVGQLLNALLIYSANDAAVALGIEVSGNLDSFIELMNTRAKELGMDSTHYISPNGLVESNNHITTASDLAILAKKDLNNKVIRQIVKKSKCEIPATNMSKKRTYESTNKLLYDKTTKVVINNVSRYLKYDGAIGVKTGYMNASGYCFVGAAERDGTEYIAVVLKAKDNNGRFINAIKMLDYGFENFYTSEMMKPGENCGKVKVKYGHKTHVQTQVKDGAYVTLPKEAAENLGDYKIVLNKDVKAPIKKGTVVGKVITYENGDKSGSADVIINESVETGGPWTALYISDLMFAIVGGLIALILILIITISIRKKKLKKKREEAFRKEREKKAMEIAMEREEKEKREWRF